MRLARHNGARSTFFVLILLLAAAGLPGRSGAQEELLQELQSISAVRLEGNHGIGDGAIRRVMKTRPPSIMPWREDPVLRGDFLRSDLVSIRELYRHYGYLDAEVDYRVVSTSESEHVEVVFLIHEGGRSRIGMVELAGVANITERDVRKRLWSRTDRAFDPAYLQLDTLQISALYQERGFRPHVVGRYVRDSLTVTVRYEVNEGERYKVGAVYLIRPEQRYHVNESLVRRELVIREGDYYSLTKMRQSQERLYESGLFSQVQIGALPDSSHTLVEYEVMVRERRPRWIDAAIGSGSAERYLVSGEWGHRNLLGRGLSGAIGTDLSADKYGKFQRWRTQVSLLEPWLFRTRTRAQVTPYFELADNRENPAYLLHQQNLGLDLQLRRELTRHLRILLTQKNVLVDQNVDIIDPTQASADSFADQYSTHRAELAFERDFRDSPYLPSRGSAQTVVGQIAGGPFRGTSSFTKLEFFSAWYTPFNNGMVLASRVRVGTMDPFGDTAPAADAADPEVARVPREDRFKTGGVNSIRGFDENRIPPDGGLTVIQGNLEMRIPTRWKVPFLGPLGFEAFFDAGNVWPRSRYIKWDQFVPSIGREPLGDFDVRYAVGVGPRIDLPIGPLRFDVTWTLRPAYAGPGYGRPKAQFAIGPSF